MRPRSKGSHTHDHELKLINILIVTIRSSDIDTKATHIHNFYSYGYIVYLDNRKPDSRSVLERHNTYEAPQMINFQESFTPQGIRNNGKYSHTQYWRISLAIFK